MSGQLGKLSNKYSELVNKANDDVKKLKLMDMAKAIEQSATLTGLTEAALNVIRRIEAVVDDYEDLMSHLDFFIRQEYNVARYKLDTTVSARYWYYNGKTNYVSGKKPLQK